MQDTLQAHGTQQLLVIRHDKIVLEWYAPDWPADRKHGTASLAKALVGGMSLLVALSDGRLKPDDPVSRAVPEWRGDPLKSKITIRQLATHTSGLDDAETAHTDARGRTVEVPHNRLQGWKGQFWKQDPEPFSVARDSPRVIFAPGTGYQYSNPGMGMLGYAITAIYKDAYADLRTLLGQRVYQPIGLRKKAWSVGYNKTFDVGGLHLVADWGGAAYTPRATARIGRLMLRKGDWQGEQLLDPGWVDSVTHYTGTPLPPRSAKQPAPASTMGWYCNADGIWPRAPRDTYLGAGAGNQVLIVIPSLQLIIVRYGESMNDAAAGEGFFYGIERYLVNMTLDALR